MEARRLRLFGCGRHDRASGVRMRHAYGRSGPVGAVQVGRIGAAIVRAEEFAMQAPGVEMAGNKLRWAELRRVWCHLGCGCRPL